jgi:UDP-glucose 4-epimerase
MKILITGGCGFIGSELVETLLKDNELFLIDNLANGYKSRIKSNLSKINFIRGDINDPKILSKVPRVDWVIHAAALSALPDNQINFSNSIENNTKACASLIDWCVKIGVKNIIFFSSSAIYEKNKKYPFFENDIQKPILMYPLSKFIAEQFFYSISKSYPVNIISLRLANIYGRNQDYFRKQPPFLGYLIKSYLTKKKLVFFAKGNHKRDYLFIDDLSNLIKKVINKKKYKNIRNTFEAYNVGSGKQYTILDFIKIFEELVDAKLKFTWGNKNNYWRKFSGLKKNKLQLDKKFLREEVEKKVILNISKVKKEFNWEPKFDIKYGLKQCLLYANKILRKNL